MTDVILQGSYTSAILEARKKQQDRLTVLSARWLPTRRAPFPYESV